MTAAALSPDGTRCVTGSYDTNVRLWNMQTGELLRTLAGHTNIVGAAAFSADGKYILTGSNDLTAKLWDASTGELVRTFERNPSVVHTVAISPDDNVVVVGAHGGTNIWDARTGERLHVILGHTRPISAMALSPEGTQVLTGGEDARVRLWSVETGDLVRDFEGHTDNVVAVAFSPDGSKVVSGGWDYSIRVWDRATGQQTGAVHGGGVVRVLSVSPNGVYLLSSATNELTLWNLYTGDILGSAPVMAGAARLPFTQDGAHFFTTSTRSVSLWSMETGEPLYTQETQHAGLATSLDISSDEAIIVSGHSFGSIGVWDTSSGRRVQTLEPGSGNGIVALLPSGRQVLSAAGGGDVTLWNLTTGERVRVYTGLSMLVYDIAVSRDGDYIAAGALDGTAKIWETETGREIRTLMGHDYAVRHVAFSLDGQYVVTASNDRTAKVWSLATGEIVYNLAHEDAVVNAVFTPDSAHVLTLAENVRMWSMETGEEIRTFDIPGGQFLSVSPDGRVFFSWDSIWDIRTGTALRTTTQTNYGDVVFTPDGSRLVAGYRDGTIRVWDARVAVDEGEGEGEGEAEGENEGEGGAEGEGGDLVHTADQDANGVIDFVELLRVIQLFNAGQYHCDASGEDGFAPGIGDTQCTPHNSDYAPQDWSIDLYEVLRAVQFYNFGGLTACPDAETEDGYCPRSPGR